MNDYYVYIYYRLDTNEPFYVGKGKGKRWKILNGRNVHFNNIVNKCATSVVIEKYDLTEEEAFYWEEEIINQLIFEYGFSIDIKNNNSDDHYCHLVNQTWGGEGTSGHNSFENKTEEEMRIIKEKMSNSCKGRNVWEEMTDERKKCIKEKMSLAHKNKFVSEETRKKLSEASKGRDTWINMEDEKREERRKKIINSHKGKKLSESSKKKISEKNKGKNSGMARKVICLTTNRIFHTIREAGRYYNCNENNIGECCKGKRKTAGKFNGQKLVWKYINWSHNKRYRIKR